MIYMFSLARENFKIAASISKLIQKILEATRQRSISFSEELETMQLSVSIENIRFNGELILETEKDSQLFLEDIKLPFLILQPFLRLRSGMG